MVCTLKQSFQCITSIKSLWKIERSQQTSRSVSDSHKVNDFFPFWKPISLKQRVDKGTTYTNYYNKYKLVRLTGEKHKTMLERRGRLRKRRTSSEKMKRKKMKKRRRRRRKWNKKKKKKTTKKKKKKKKKKGKKEEKEEKEEEEEREQEQELEEQEEEEGERRRRSRRRRRKKERKKERKINRKHFTHDNALYITYDTRSQPGPSRPDSNPIPFIPLYEVPS